MDQLLAQVQPLIAQLQSNPQVAEAVRVGVKAFGQSTAFFDQVITQAKANIPVVPITKHINFEGTYFQLTFLAVILCPLIWNILARSIRTVLPAKTPMFFRYIICYLLTAWIFSFSAFRDYLFHKTISSEQPVLPLSALHPAHVQVGYVLIGLGQLFVITSFLKLGITGTFLGDYCGIFMKHRVESFPFNVLNNPMYIGSTLSFLGTSILYRSPAGVAIAIHVFVVYHLALIFEESYTNKIYSEKAIADAKAALAKSGKKQN